MPNHRPIRYQNTGHKFSVPSLKRMFRIGGCVGLLLTPTPLLAGEYSFDSGGPLLSDLLEPSEDTPTTLVHQLLQDKTVHPIPAVKRSNRDQFPVVELSGEAAIIFSQASGDSSQGSLRPGLGRRLRLDIEASFDGNDRLRLRLQNTNVVEYNDVFETDLARLSIQGDDGGEVSLSRLDYQFSLGERTDVLVPVVGGSISDIAEPLNPGLSGSGSGSIARFSQRNPLYRQGGGAGVGITHEVSDRLDLSVGYLSDAQNLLPTDEYVALAQATYQISDSIDVGLLYVYGFNALRVQAKSRPMIPFLIKVMRSPLIRLGFRRQLR